MPLALVLSSHSTNGIENGIISFLRSRQLKWGSNWSRYARYVSVTLYWWHHQWHNCIPYVKMIEMRCIMTFCSSAMIGTDISSTWFWWHCQWHHCISWVKMMEMWCNVTFLDMSCLWHYCWHHKMPSALAKAPLHSLGQDNENVEQNNFLVMWHNCHCHWHQMLPLGLVSYDAIGLSVSVTWYVQHH